MRKISLFFLLSILIYSCGSNEQGELMGVRSKSKWHSKKPSGMVMIPGGSYTMGKQDEDLVGDLNAPARTVTVRPFYMDETEISNSEYKEFVHWVRDSIARFHLADLSDLMSDETNIILPDYQYKDADTSNLTPYQKYMINNYGGLGDIDSPSMGRALNWNEELIWSLDEIPDEYYAEVMDTMFISVENSIDGKRILDTKKLQYLYFWFDSEEAARGKKERKNYIKSDTVLVYPDTTVWVKDFNFSYNDPMHQDYFHHEAYSDYPVVGVSWTQAKAFCSWRTKKKNDYLASKKNSTSVPHFRLASEAEWEYAARGGLNFAKFPWGGPYTTTDRGCFLANFKPSRGDYAVDGALYTMEVNSYNANDYGLYNMAGNVSEWTNTTYSGASYKTGSTMNPSIEIQNNYRKIIRGGSWKDVAYFLEVSTRDYEYKDSARSYIGFRTVQDYLGTNLN